MVESLSLVMVANYLTERIHDRMAATAIVSSGGDARVHLDESAALQVA